MLNYAPDYINIFNSKFYRIFYQVCLIYLCSCFNLRMVYFFLTSNLIKLFLQTYLVKWHLNLSQVSRLSYRTLYS